MSEEVAVSTTSIVVADDHTVMRSGLKALLDAEPDLEVVAEAGDSAEAIRKLKAHKPTVLLIDLHMPRPPSPQFIAAMREASPETKIVVLTMRGAAEPDDDGPPDNLTEREVEVLRLIALGHTNTEIASQLYLSVRTVESHRAHIQQKLRLSRRAELVRYALDHRLVQAEPRA